MRTTTLYRVFLRSNSYTEQVFEAQAPTAAFKAALVHKHSEVRLVAHVELGISRIKQVNWLIRLAKTPEKAKSATGTYGTLWHVVRQICERVLRSCGEN